MIVFVTKYSLSTSKIMECEVDHEDGKYVWVKWPGAMNGKAMFSNDDCHRSRSAAETKVDVMRTRKIESLQKQITKLEKMKFKFDQPMAKDAR